MPVPVQRAPRRPVIVPAGRIVRSRPGNGVYRTTRGHRTRSTFRSTLGRRRPSLSEIRRAHRVPKMGTHVNEYVTGRFVSGGSRLILKTSHGSVDMKIKVVVHDAAEGGFWAEVPAIPGCATQGETMDELLGSSSGAVGDCCELPAAITSMAKRVAWYGFQFRSTATGRSRSACCAISRSSPKFPTMICSKSAARMSVATCTTTREADPGYRFAHPGYAR
jgi:predicted RNase H-like HicB family nuclease